MMSRERNLERKSSRGGSSLGKRTRDSQVESVHGFATRGRRQGPTMTQDFDRRTSNGQEKRIECPHCHKHHPSTCRWIIGGCFRCGNIDHLIVNYPRGFGSFRNPQGISRGGSNVPPSTRDRGRGRGSSGEQGRGIASEKVNRLITTVPS